MRLSIPSLLPGTDYAIQVRSNDGAQQSEWSSRYELTTTSDTVPPALASNVVWRVSGDSFYAEWDAVQTNTGAKSSIITRYEIELVGNSITKIVSVPQQTGTKMNYTLAFEANRAYFTNPAATVTFRVRAVDNKNIKSAWTSIVSAVNPAPGIVTALAPTTTTNGIQLAWTAPVDNDLSGYNVYASTTANFTPGAGNFVGNSSSTFYTFNTTTYTTWNFVVRAVDKFGSESAIVRTSATPTNPFSVDTVAPSTPTALTASIANNANGTLATATVGWTMTSPPTDLSDFFIRWRKVGETNYNQTRADRDTRALTIELAQAYQNYEFQIRASDFSANYSAWSATTTATAPSNAIPAQVVGLSVAAGKDNLQISWTENTEADVKSGAGTYHVQVATNSAFSTGLLDYKTGATNISVNGLATNTSYWIRVQATDSAGANGFYSSVVSTTTGTFPLTPKTDGNAPSYSPTPTVTGKIGSLAVEWLPVPNADLVTYEVHISTTSNFTPASGTKSGELSGTFASIEKLPGNAALAYGVPYYVRLIAKDGDGPAPVGVQASATLTKATSNDLNVTVGGGNQVNNSSFVNDISGWATSGGTHTLSYSTARSVHGNSSMLSTVTGDSSTRFYTTSVTAFSVAPFEPISVSAYVYLEGSSNRNLKLELFAKLADGTTVYPGATFLPDAMPLNTWTRVVGTVLMPSTAVAIDRLQFVMNNSITGDKLYVDGVQLERGDVATAWAYSNADIQLFAVTSAGQNTDTKISNYNATTVVPLDSRVTAAQLAADAGIAQQWMNPDPTFSLWPGALPTGWNLTGQAPVKETTIVRTSTSALRWDTTSTAQAYIDRTFTGFTSDYIVVETDVRLISGNFAGAALLVDWNGQSANRTRVDLNLEVPNPSLNTWYRITKVIKKPAGITTTPTSYRAFVMANWTGANGGYSVKSIVYDKFGIRQASAEEITAYETPGQLSTINTAVGGSVNTYSTEYSVNSSETIAPNTGWSTATPTRNAGTFVWTRVLVTKNDGSSYYTNPALLTGNTGAQGNQGNAGAPAPLISLTSTTQVLTSPSTGTGATSPTTAVITGAAFNTTISAYSYSVDGADYSTTVPAGVSKTGNVVTITGASMTAKTIGVKMADAAGVADTMTVAKVLNGAAGADGGAGAGGADAYTVILSNEANVFAGSTNAAVTGNTTSSVIAYKGATQTTATIGTITGTSSGITAVISNNGTTNATVTVSVNPALTAPSGTLVFPVTVDGKVFNKTFSWSVSYQGSAGNNGTDGAAGAPGGTVSVTGTSQALISASTGTGATSPATSVVTGTAANTTITGISYSVDGGGFTTNLPTGASISGNVVTITGANMTAKTITVKMSDAAGVTDSFTVAKVLNGAAGSNGGAGADAYTVVLTNEANVFAGTTTTAIASNNTTTSVIAYKGATQQVATIGTPTGLPTGMTTAITNNGTTSPVVTFTVSTSFTTRAGTVTIPVTVDGKVFNKIFSYSISFQGATGGQGGQGNPGVSITGVTPYYYPSIIGTAAPAKPTTATPPSPWTTAEVAYAFNTEVWRTENITYSDGTFTYTNVNRDSAYTGAYLANSQLDAWKYPGTNLIDGADIREKTVTTNVLNVIMGGGNLLSNSSFERSLDGWSLSNASTTTAVVDTTKRYYGNNSVRIINTAPGQDTFLLANLPANPNTTYTASAWVFVDSITAGAVSNRSILFYSPQGGDVTANTNMDSARTTGKWVRETAKITTGPNSTTLQIRLYAPQGTVYWDAVQIEEGDVPTAYAPKTDEILPGTINGTMLQTEIAIVDSMLVKSKLEVQVGGYIQSSNYSTTANSGAGSGYRLTDTLLDIRSGTVAANTLVAGTGIITNLVIQPAGTIQSSVFNSTTGFKISNAGIELNDANSKVSAAALTGGTITGKQFIVGAGGSFVLDSTGYMQSNNYAAGSTGWRLYSNSAGNPAFELNSGSVKVETLQSGTVTAKTISLATTGVIQSSGYVQGTSTTGFKLSGTGLEIPDGSILARSLSLQSGTNIIHPVYSDFEADKRIYDIFGGQALISTISIVTGKSNTGVFGSGSLATTWSTATVNPTVFLGTTQTDYNLPVTANSPFIYSAYVWCAGTVATNVQMKLKASNGTIYTLASVNLPVNGTPLTAVRMTGVATTTVNGGILYFESSTRTANGGFNVDGVQVEPKTSTAVTPSTWTPSSSTYLDGAQVKTGSIISNAPSGFKDTSGNDIPTWSINFAGAAQFASASILGNTVIGNGAADAMTTMSSSNFGTGTGWTLRANGTSEMRELILVSSDIANNTDSGNAPALRIGNVAGAHLRVSDDRLIAMGSPSSQGVLQLNVGGETSSTKFVVTAIDDAAPTAGNKPPLRIGNIAGNHMRIDGEEIIAMIDDVTPGTLILNAPGLTRVTRFEARGSALMGYTVFDGALAGVNSQLVLRTLAADNTTNGTLIVEGGGNILGKLRGGPDTSAAISFIAGGIAGATIATFNASSFSAANTTQFWANGFIDPGLSGGSSAIGASINTNGRIIKTGSSSLRYKKNISPLSIDVAKTALSLKAVTFAYRQNTDMGDPSNPMYPGFIAEQADEVGAKLWVYYDSQGRPDGFKYGELTAAHNMLLSELYSELEAQKEVNNSLEARLKKLEDLLLTSL